ncbi:MAG TPA: NUDIX hydrolase [Hyphomicrobiales bacterium]|nr:NUDIX hydrolase [Rhodobiaceae bacterium]HXK54017.1 NUDIX hydrolase [Hyphomicrobiales bacterium]
MPASGPQTVRRPPLPFKPLRPQNAATLILVDRSGATPKVLMGRRHRAHRFLPGKFVFPGGRVDPADSRIRPASDFTPETMRRLLVKMRGGARPNAARALALAAIRETFEEAGLLIGRQHPAPPRSRSPSWHRFFAHGVVPDLEDVVFVARAITPPRRARRFDARFFALDASAIATDAGRIETPADELLELAWLTFDEARTIEIPNITRIVLYEIEQRLAEGRLAAPERPVPFFYMRGRTFTREIL